MTIGGNKLFKIYDGRSQFYQWDLDRKIIVSDDTINQVHFCNRTDDCSLVCEVYELDGLRVADVPNILLQDDWRINVYGYDHLYTKHSDVFEVVKRSKPADYVYTETEVLNYNTLLERLDDIETNIGQAVEDYIEEHPVEVDLTGYATETYVDEALAAIELTPGPAGKDGADGKDGKDGAPGYTPVKGVDYFDGKDGVDGAPGADGKDYVLTDADKQEIADMVDVPEIDATNYYTKSEIDELLANLPAGGDLPAAEEVGF